MQPFQMPVQLTVGGEFNVVPFNVVTGPAVSLSLSQTMTSSLVTEVLSLCNACSLVATALSKQIWKLFLEELDTFSSHRHGNRRETQILLSLLSLSGCLFVLVPSFQGFLTLIVEEMSIQDFQISS